MATIKKFEEIEAWKRAREVTNEIYKLTFTSHFDKDYQLKNHLRKTATSIMSNIAEGFDRGGNKEFNQFLSVAKGSCRELQSQLYIAFDQKYLNKEEFEKVYSKIWEVKNTIRGLSKYLRNSTLQASKYIKEPESEYEPVNEKVNPNKL